jgi:hypothetical protein
MCLDITKSKLALGLILLLMVTGAPFFEGKAAGQQSWPHIPFSTEHNNSQKFSLASLCVGVVWYLSTKTRFYLSDVQATPIEVNKDEPCK